MSRVFSKKNDCPNDRPVVKIIYSKDGSNGLREAYRLLAKKVLEEREKRCVQQSMSE